jgi:glycogen operon protein
MWLNASHEDVEVHLPRNEWVRSGEVVLSTNADLPVGTAVRAGTRVNVQARSVVVLREASPNGA